MQTIKVVLVGDSRVGKVRTERYIAANESNFSQSIMHYVFIYKQLPPDPRPVTFDSYAPTIMVKDKPYTLAFFDTLASEEYDRLRPLSYPQTDVFIVCFSVDSHESLTHVREKWIPEIEYYSPGVPRVLVATKVDLRTDPATVRRLAERHERPLTSEQGERMAKDIGATAYVECSALTLSGLDEVFDKVVEVALNNEPSVKSPTALITLRHLFLELVMEQQAKATPEIRKVAVFLRSGKAGIKVRVGALNGKRFDYFKGKSAIKALLSPAYAKLKGVPKITNEAEAIATLALVNSFAFFLRVQRGAASGSSSSSPKVLQVIPEQKFVGDEYYVWFFEGSQWTTYAGAILMVGVMLAGVMFPLWPPIMRQGVYYLSMGMLGLIGLFFAIAIVRLIFYIITVIVASPGIWIFPKLFADVGFVESFIPLYEWDLPKKKSKKKKGDKGKAEEPNGEEVEDSGVSRPQSRAARVEEVEDEDA
ncbi:Translocation protein [Mycena chlorophos]|uniref:Translocation protein SEC62 n=1 Tax=Mycena chlorophos TaxID=658473 RepID=A0A8H6WHN7_MYCCL|nr:Translocation protein [Mycena chlorophos]